MAINNEANLNSVPSIFRDKISILSFLFSILIDGAGWVLLLSFIRPQEDPIFLHYSIYFGVDLIGEWYRIFYIPAVALIIILVNFFLSVIIYKHDVIIARIISGTTIIIQFIALISILLLIRLNI